MLILLALLSIQAGSVQSSPVNACTFLQDSTVAEALGLPMAPGIRDDSGPVSKGPYAAPGAYSSTCLWKVKGDPVKEAGYAILNVIRWPTGPADAHKFLKSFWDAARSGDIEQQPVPLKIADEALWWGDGVAVRKGAVSFGISVHLPGRRPEERVLEEKLAREIVARM